MAIMRTATVDVEWLVDQISGRGAAAVRDSITSLISSGELVAGAQLPTIREFAKAAGTSIGTIADSWGALRDAGLIETRRRGGTIVAARAPSPAAASPTRSGFAGWSQIDLVQSNADVTLQPPLGDALLSSLDARDLNASGRDYMTDRLRSAVEPDWPFSAEAWTTAGGGTEALLLATAAAAPQGSIVAVDEPVIPGFLDTLHDLGLVPVGVVADAHGPTVGSLRAALARHPVAFVFQPGAPFAIDHTVSQQRVTELARVLRDHDEQVWVIEDDSIGPLALQDAPTMGALLPQQVLRIRSYCKAYGIDVRTSVLGGSGELVRRSVNERSHGVGSNSRILQNALAFLITSPETQASVERARESYATRRGALVSALGRAGLVAHAGTGSLVVWIEVDDETDAVLALAAQGISVGSGRKSFVTQPERGLLRVSVTQLPDEAELLEEFAQLIGSAARGSLREYFD